MVLEEARGGRLDKMYMYPAPVGVVMRGRSFVTLAVAAGQAAIIGGVLIVVLRLQVGFDPPVIAASAPVVALTLMGQFGFGFIVAGFAISTQWR